MWAPIPALSYASCHSSSKFHQAFESQALHLSHGGKYFHDIYRSQTWPIGTEHRTRAGGSWARSFDPTGLHGEKFVFDTVPGCVLGLYLLVSLTLFYFINLISCMLTHPLVLICWVLCLPALSKVLSVRRGMSHGLHPLSLSLFLLWQLTMSMYTNYWLVTCPPHIIQDMRIFSNTPQWPSASSYASPQLSDIFPKAPLFVNQIFRTWACLGSSSHLNQKNIFFFA